MGYYLVDYENVNKDGMNGISKLKETDTVCIFYSENADTLTFSLHKRINESKAQVSFVKVEARSKNALDFQLSTHLGYTIAGDKNDSYFIVSKDNGFGAVCAYWQKRGVEVSIVADLSGLNLKKESEMLQADVSRIISDQTKVETVVAFIQKYKTKQGINNALCKEYGTNAGGEIYKNIKPLIKNKKGSDA